MVTSLLGRLDEVFFERYKLSEVAREVPRKIQGAPKSQLDPCVAWQLGKVRVHL